VHKQTLLDWLQDGKVPQPKRQAIGGPEVRICSRKDLRMARKYLIFAFNVALFLPAVSISSAFGGNPSPVSPEIQQRLTKKYPNQKMVNGCNGKFLGKESDAVAVLHNPAKKEFLVVWVMSQGEIQELAPVAQTDTSAELELQCMDAKEAKERQDALKDSEGISSSLAIPKGSGAVCYFINYTEANCWTLDRASGRLIRAGGWET
jgi:hypothetical protein